MKHLIRMEIISFLLVLHLQMQDHPANILTVRIASDDMSNTIRYNLG